jgi:hypothetical protein
MRHRWAVGAGYPVCKKLAKSRKGPVDQTSTAATTVRLGVTSPPTTSYLLAEFAYCLFADCRL